MDILQLKQIIGHYVITGKKNKKKTKRLSSVKVLV